MSDPTASPPPATPRAPATPATVAEWLNMAAGLASLGKTKDALGALWAGVEDLLTLVAQLRERIELLERSHDVTIGP